MISPQRIPAIRGANSNTTDALTAARNDETKLLPVDVAAIDVPTPAKPILPIDEANVELVWDPPWNQSMMTEAAKLQLGLL